MKLRSAFLTAALLGLAAAGVHADGQRLVGHMMHDKKVVGDVLPFILTRGIGAAYVDKQVDRTEVQAFLDAQPK